MKLMLQIAGGVVLGWIAVTLIKAILAIGALSVIGQALHIHDAQPQLPALQRTAPAMPAPAQTAPYRAPPTTTAQTTDQLDGQDQTESAKARSDHEAASGQSPASPGYSVRKATPEDAAAKPAR
jgi:hypothetical protein